MLVTTKRKAEKLIRCSCGQVLGEWVAGYILIRHGGREVLVKQIEAITCERCGLVYRDIDSKSSECV